MNKILRAVQEFVKLSANDPLLRATPRRRLTAVVSWIVGGIMDAAMTSVALYARTNFVESNPYAAFLFAHVGLFGAWIFDAAIIAGIPLFLWKHPRFGGIIFTDIVTLGGAFRMLLASITIILLVGTNL